MFKPKKQPTFKRIEKFIQQIDTVAGIFLFKDANTKETILNKFCRLTLLRLAILYPVIVISTLIITDFELLSIILSCSTGTVIVSVYSSLTILIIKKQDFKDLLKWCEDLYDEENKYHEAVHETVENYLKVIEARTLKMLICLRKIIYIDAFAFTVGFVLLGMFLPANIHPKFSAPLPFYLPFKNQETWLAFITTVLTETTIAVDAASIGIYFYGTSFCSFFHILGYLDIIQQLTEQMKREMLLNEKQNRTKRQHGKLSVINEDSTTVKNKTLSFDEWIEVLNLMLVDVSSTITKFNGFWSTIFFTNEIASFGGLFIFGLIFTVVREQYIFGIAASLICLLLYIVCFANEKILERLEKINETLYDLPWYNFAPEQRKTLMILMHCDKIQKGLTAAGIHTLTIERFGIIVKAGYTNLLVLKDLVQK